MRTSTSKRTMACGVRQAGFAIASAIFILVVLALMAAFIVHVTTLQQAGHMADLRGVRAYQAARAGIERGLHNHLRNAVCAESTFGLGGNLAEFTVTVQCLQAGAAAANDENGTALVVRRLVATACNQPNAAGTCPNLAPGVNYVEREVAAVARR